MTFEIRAVQSLLHRFFSCYFKQCRIWGFTHIQKIIMLMVIPAMILYLTFQFKLKKKVIAYKIESTIKNTILKDIVSDVILVYSIFFHINIIALTLFC